MRTQTLKTSDLALENSVNNRAIYLLGLIALVQYGYPITAYGTGALIVYEILYASMIVAGVIVGRDSLRHMAFLTTTGIIFFAGSLGQSSCRFTALSRSWHLGRQMGRCGSPN